MALVSIALVDDHPIMLHGLAQVFASHNQYTVLAQGQPAQALALAQAYRPEIMIIGASDPGCLVATVACLTQHCPATRVIVYAGLPGADHAVRALEAGARGYAAKAGGVDELLQAVRLVHQDEIYISRGFATGVITALQNESVRKAALQKIKLNVRENQIVQLLLRGKTNREIATQLAIGEKTVKHYMTSLMQKLSARNRTEAVLAAQELIRLRPDAGSAHLN